MTASEQLDTSALIADLESIAPSAQRGHRCQTGGAIASLPDEARPVFAAMIDRPDLSPAAICNVLAKHGIDLQAQNLARHRRRGTPTGCRCPK